MPTLLRPTSPTPTSVVMGGWGHYAPSTLTGSDFSGAIVAGADFGHTTSSGFSKEQLYSTASYQQKNLQGIGLNLNDLSGWNFFSGQDLADASFGLSTLTGTGFSGAIVAGVSIGGTTDNGFTKEQLYSTASYQQKNLQGIGLDGNDLSGWDFSGQNLANADMRSSTLTNADLAGANLTNARLYSSTLTNANLSGANLTNARLWNSDLRGATGFPPEDSNHTQNTIWPDGHIEDLTLRSDTYYYYRRLTVHDYTGVTPIPITVESSMSVDPRATLQLVFEDQDWGSTMSFKPGIDVDLRGILELTFARGTNPSRLVGTTFQLFNWEGVAPTGRIQEGCDRSRGSMGHGQSLYHGRSYSDFGST